MRAMILAAGLGTRLRPLTFVRPKVLVPVLGRTMLEFWLEMLQAQGTEGVVVNAFHHPEMLMQAVRHQRFPFSTQVKVEMELLGTAGGIRNVVDFFCGEHFVVINGDIVCDAPLKELYAQHLKSGAEVSLLFHDWPAFNQVAVDAAMRVCGFGADAARLSRERKDVRMLAFTGIHFMSPAVVDSLPIGKPEDIIKLYRDLIARQRPPQALMHPNLLWREMGSIESYWRLNHELATFAAEGLFPFETAKPFVTKNSASIADGAELNGMVVVGARSHVEKGARLTNVILWDEVRVGKDSILQDCIVTDGVVVKGRHEKEILWSEDHGRLSCHKW